MASDPPRCRNCRFWVEIKLEDPEAYIGPYGEILDRTGHCCRYPPQLNSENEGRWPAVHERGWCGEHQPGFAPFS